MTDRETFLARAAEARSDADSAALENVRQRCLRAEAAWAAMAARAERNETMRARIDAEKAATVQTAQASEQWRVFGQQPELAVAIED